MADEMSNAVQDTPRSSHFIPGVIETTGLPREIWHVFKPSPRSGGRREYSITDSHFEAGRTFTLGVKKDWIKTTQRTISVLRHLPAAHVLGQAVLLRLVTGTTAMVSIAEAAGVMLGESRSELLWATIKLVERYLRGDRSPARLRWKRELTFPETFETIYNLAASIESQAEYPLGSHSEELHQEVIQVFEQLDKELDAVQEIAGALDLGETNQTSAKTQKEDVRQAHEMLGETQQVTEGLKRMMESIHRLMSDKYSPNRDFQRGRNRQDPFYLFLPQLQSARDRVRTRNDKMRRRIMEILPEEAMI